MPTQMIVVQNAFWPSELVTASIGWLRPCSKVRKKIIPTGTITSAARYRRTMERRPRRVLRLGALMLRPPVRKHVERNHQADRDRQEKNRNGRCARVVAGLDPPI